MFLSILCSIKIERLLFLKFLKKIGFFWQLLMAIEQDSWKNHCHFCDQCNHGFNLKCFYQIPLTWWKTYNCNCKSYNWIHFSSAWILILPNPHCQYHQSSFAHQRKLQIILLSCSSNIVRWVMEFLTQKYKITLILSRWIWYSRKALVQLVNIHYKPAYNSFNSYI